VRVIQSARVHSRCACAPRGGGTSLENLEGKYTRKQNGDAYFHTGELWSLNCGASTFKADEARARFAELQPFSAKIFGSFGFLK